eukprot:COSAG01_NODE_5654_length_4115_cov_4.459412_2_plen_97_part_00
MPTAAVAPAWKLWRRGHSTIPRYPNTCLPRTEGMWPNISGGTQVCTAFSKSVLRETVLKYVLRFGKSVLRFMKFFCRSSKTKSVLRFGKSVQYCVL